MRFKRNIFVIVVLLVIGFAGVATNFIINGVTLIGENDADFKIFFSEAILDNKDKTNSLISSDKQEINFETNELSVVGDESILKFEVTNNSRQYDAEVVFNCTAKDSKIYDYVDVTYEIETGVISAKTKANGFVKAKLKKAYAGEEFDKTITCKAGATAKELDTANDAPIDTKNHYTYGYLVDNNNPVEGAVIVAYSSDAKYVKTDARGMFIIDELEGGDYEVYVLKNKTLEEAKNYTKEELEDIASDKSSFNTTDKSFAFKNYENKYSKIVPGDPQTRTATLDVNGGLGSNIETTLIEGEPVGFLPSVDHETLAFLSWNLDGEKVNETDVISTNTLVASFNSGVAAIGEKHFRTLNQAFDYVKTPSLTTIDVLESNTLVDDIDNDKNVILNLNEKIVRLDDYKMSNTGNLTIKNGYLKTEGANVLTNSGVLNLSDNLSIEHINNTNETVVLNTIINNKNATLSMDDTSVYTEFTHWFLAQSMISNYGDITINNSNLETRDAVIFIYENSNLEINDSNVKIANAYESGQMFYVYGKLDFNNTTVSELEENATSNGAIKVNNGGVANINSGTLDNTYGKSNLVENAAGGSLNIGSENAELNIIGNATGSYTLYNNGSFKIVDGTINASKGYFIGNVGKILIGSEDATPTINGAYGYNAITIRSTTDENNNANRIVNANINANNAFAINVYANSKLVIDNINVVQNNATTTNRSVNINGTLIVNDGTFKIHEDNLKAYGFFNVQATGVLTLNSGVYDNTHGTSNLIWNAAGSQLNIGEKNKELTFIGNNTSSYIISSSGNLNIKDGTLNADKGHFIGGSGRTIIGSEDAIPTINGAHGYSILDVRSSTEENNEANRIVNANINAYNNYAIQVYANSKLVIDNINVVQKNDTSYARLVSVSGTLIVNDGTFKMSEENTTGVGLFNVNGTGVLSLIDGTYNNLTGTGIMITSNAGSVLNIGEENKELTFIGNNSSSSIISSSGSLNIKDGIINVDKGDFIRSYGRILIGSENAVPTINGAYGYSILDVGGNTEEDNNANRIVNANINEYDSYAIYVYAGKKLTIDNINVTLTNKTSYRRAILVYGTLTINDGVFRTTAENVKGEGLIQLYAGATATINSGEFDNKYGYGGTISANENTTLNVGSKDKEIKIIGNGVQESGIFSTTFYSAGDLNIIDGTIYGSNGQFMRLAGKSTIGTETTTPTINFESNNDSFNMIEYMSGTEHIIKSAVINCYENRAIMTYTGTKLIIENANVNQINTSNYSVMINVYYGSELTINDGVFSSTNENNSSSGIFSVGQNSVLNIDGGEFNYKGNNNLITSSLDSEINIGENKKADISISATSDKYPTISSNGKLNIYSGHISAHLSNAIVQTMSDYDKENAKDKYPITNIYGGKIENTSSTYPTVAISDGIFTMYDGEVKNNGSSNTIYNNGGTAIQKGGISAKNYGVTIK